jgi:hypothetical protein
VSGEVSGVAGADLRLVVWPAGTTFGPPGALPLGARVFDAGGPGAGEKLDGVPWPAGAPSPIVVVQRKLESAKSTSTVGDKRHHAASGLDVEYALSLRLRP